MLYLGPQSAPIALDPTQPLFEQIKWLLTSPKVRLRLANGKYDMIWVKEKWDIDCTNFTFDNLLVGSLLNENRSNSLNLHAKLMTDIGGYDDCVAPETRLLTSDLRWVPAGDVTPGMELIGFDEHNGGPKGTRRKLRTAVVEFVKRIVKPGMRLVLSNGVAINCSSDHGFLAPTGKNGGATYWKRGYELKVGDRLKIGFPVEVSDVGYDAGWLSGFIDGEGFLSHAGPGLCMGWTQKPGLAWDRSIGLAERYGITGYVREKAVDGCLTTKFAGWQALRLLQLIRPVRLLAKRGYEGLTVPQEPEPVTIVQQTYLGKLEVTSIQTSTRTFIAEGVCSHNSFNDKYDKGHMEAVPTKELGMYQGGDTDAATRRPTCCRRSWPKTRS